MDLKPGDRVRAYLDPNNTTLDYVDGTIQQDNSLLVSYDNWATEYKDDPMVANLVGRAIPLKPHFKIEKLEDQHGRS